MTATSLSSPADLAQLAERGVSPAEAERQLALLARPAAWARLERPCTVGDGIERLDESRIEALHAAHARAAAAGRVSAFVPASGAATRMFRELLAARELPGELDPDDIRRRQDPVARSLVQFVDELPRFAFAGPLAERLAGRGQLLERLRTSGPWRPLLAAFLDADGLDAARSPKGLLPFHREGGQVRTPFEEHLIESCAFAGDATGTRALDVTVSAEHRAGFERLFAERIPELTGRWRGRWEVTFSEQGASTDTLAASPGSGPFRDEHGRLLFRPAGHGALIGNLERSHGELVFLKNIDNVAVDRLKPETARWSRALLGLAAELSERVRTFCTRLAAGEPSALEAARAFASAELGLELPQGLAAREAAAMLDRPLRVCGMVANTGEPGGGPFWVRAEGGVTRQIVESAQVELSDADQARAFRAATHFNPVFMAVALADARGGRHVLSRFVDDSAVIVTRKSHAGRELLALERPGLWNGAMARWHTRFVEVPLAVFNPVKSVFDLLRPEHQGE
jgi:hypothetical protein